MSALDDEDLRIKIKRLRTQYTANRGCKYCGSRVYHEYRLCPASTQRCKGCKSMGHFQEVCLSSTKSKRQQDNNVFVFPAKDRECRNCGIKGHFERVCRKPPKPHRQDRKDTTAGDRKKKERSESVVNNEPRKPRRNENDRNFPRRGEREKRAGDRKNDSNLTKKQEPTALLTQKYAGLSHSKLPIRSTRDTGTPAEQHKKWLSDDPKRFHKVQVEIELYKIHFMISREKPVALEKFDGEGQEILDGWRDGFLDRNG